MPPAAPSPRPPPPVGCREGLPRPRPAAFTGAGAALVNAARSARRGLLHVLLGVGGELLAVLLALLLHGLLGALGRLLGDLLAALEGLLAGLLRLLLDVVGDRAELLVLDARGRQQHPDEEADGGGADGQAERVLLGDARGA